MKRKTLFILVSLLWFGFLIMAADTEAAPAASIELKVANFQPTMHKSNEMLENWGKLIEKETGGKVRLVLFPNATLAKPNDTYDAAVTGIADICWTVAGYTANRFPLSEIIILHLGFKNSEHASRVLYDLYQKFPEIRAEYKDTHLLWLSPAPPRQTHSRVPVRSIDDFKGLKVRVPSSEAPNVKALGGIPVTMAGPEVYQALERGILDADLHPWETPISYKWYEVVRYHTKSDLGPSALFVTAMNLNTWNKLPDDVKKVIDKYSGKYGYIEVAAKGMWDKYDNYYLEWIKKNTHNEIIYWSDEEKAKAQKLMGGVVNQWVADMEKRGLPGKKIMDECINLVGKYK
jgi:TRAP-type C4-dicarboxylate transport system substrate-binding protein